MVPAFNQTSSAANFQGNVIMIGCGSIGQAVLPLLGRHLENIYGRTTVLAADESGRGLPDASARNSSTAICHPATTGAYSNSMSGQVI